MNDSSYIQELERTGALQYNGTFGAVSIVRGERCLTVIVDGRTLTTGARIGVLQHWNLWTRLKTWADTGKTFSMSRHAPAFPYLIEFKEKHGTRYPSRRTRPTSFCSSRS